MARVLDRHRSVAHDDPRRLNRGENRAGHKAAHPRARLRGAPSSTAHDPVADRLRTLDGPGGMGSDDKGQEQVGGIVVIDTQALG